MHIAPQSQLHQLLHFKHQNPLSLSLSVSLFLPNMKMFPQALPYLFLLLYPLHKLSGHAMGTSKSFAMPTSSHFSSPQLPPKVFNVDDFGANGKVDDDREAFLSAWKEACSSLAPAFLLVPENKRYFLKPVSFNGPCRSEITVMIKGTLEASSSRSDWDGEDGTIHWILFNKVADLTVEGRGTVNGNGQSWWKNSCKINSNLPCTVAPTALTFYSCSQLKVKNLRILDSQQIHISVEQCINVSISNLEIRAPEKSPNTDGIHVSNTINMRIERCVIRTGDDCISIVTGSKNIRVNRIECGPGHGISIGSLGEKNSVAEVSDVVVDTVNLNGTTNGVRIKSWQGGQGHAKNIVFQNIIMQNVYNPIIIDQSYCDSPNPCRSEESAVSISKVTYKNIRGTSASKLAVNLNCSRASPCQKIKMENVRLVENGGESAESLCENARLEIRDVVFPTCV